MTDETTTPEIGQDIPATCGGIAKPTHSGPGAGQWVCNDGEWFWKRDLGGV